MDTTTVLKPHKNADVQEFLVRLRGIACSPSNPQGIIAETLAANLGTRTPTLRAWLHGRAAPHPITTEALMRRLNKISNPTASAPVPVPSAGQILGSGRV